MTVETLKDFMKWTQSYHQQLALCMKECAAINEDDKAKMLLEYISGHEKKLEKVIDGFAHSPNESALDTWVYEFFKKTPPVQHAPHCSEPFKNLDVQGILDLVVVQHNEILSLYRDLFSRAETESTKEVLEQLVALEEAHIKQIVHSINRMSDL